MDVLDLLKAREAVMAFPEATITLLLGGLVIGWVSSFAFAHRELKVNRLIIAELRQSGLSEAAKAELLKSAVPRQKLGPWFKSFSVVLFTAGIAALVAWLMQPRIPTGWSISAKQEQALKITFAATQKKFVVRLSVVPGAPSDAVAFGYKLMNLIGSSGWPTVLAVIDPEYSPIETGITIGVKTGTDPQKNEKAKFFLSVFEAAGFHPVTANDNQLKDDDDAKIVIGKHP